MHINTRFSFHVSLTDFWKKKWFRDEGLSNGLSSDRVDSLHILQIGYKNLPLYSYLRSIIDHGVQIQQANERKQSSKQGEGLVAKKKKKKNSYAEIFLWPSLTHMEVHCFYHLESPGDPVWKEK